MMVLEQEKKDALLRAMADEYERKILLSTLLQEKSIEQIARETSIPMSTCYRRVHEMVKFRVLRIERTIITEEGKKYETYRSAVKGASIVFSVGEDLSVDVTLTPPRTPEDNLRKMWNALHP